MENIKEILNSELFDLSHTIAGEIFENTQYPFEVLPKIGDFIKKIGKTLDTSEYDCPSENVWIHKTAKIYPNTYIEGGVIIGAKTEVRPGAFIRGNALVGEGVVVGNSTELKNCILFDGVQVPHYNYVGDSIFGYKAHTGAGSIMSNVKADKSLVTVRGEGYKIETGIKKFGAMLGDFAEIGCNSVLNPGTIVCRNSVVQPLSSVRGVVKANAIFKRTGQIVTKI
ncbi:MAG: UDP-N-acetylglucosamine pyrophosphorylase [Bacillota bacterium]